MPLQADSQHYLSFITPSGVYQATRTLQGVNSAQIFQSRVEPCFQCIGKSVTAWLDDFAVHNKTEDGLIKLLRKFFSICRERNLKISVTKTVLFCKNLEWCGYVVDQEGVRCDPRRLGGLKNGCHPVNAAELSQFVNCLQWMSNYIPDYATRVAPLRKILEQAYRRSEKRTSRSVQNIRLAELEWSPGEITAFEGLQEQLGNAVTLGHRDVSKALCVFTDASGAHWAAVVTQCDASCLGKEIEDQMHQPLAFLGSLFNDTQQHWSTFEREAYAIFQSFEKMDYMFACEEDIHIFTDHRNLLFVFNTLALKPMLGRHIVNKVQRWALFLSRFMYSIEHIAGERNVAADMMTRWYAGYRGKKKLERRITSLLMAQDLVQSPADEDFAWPSIDTVRQCQEARNTRPEGLNHSEDGLWKKPDNIWILFEAMDLQMKLLVVAHCGASGRRETDSTISRLKEQYTWDSMEADAAELVSSCLHCIISKTVNRIPRPISLTLHGTSPNEVVNFDYLFMGPGTDGFKYVLVIRDDLSSYFWLFPCKAADSSTAAKEISRWIRVFTAMEHWVSDQCSHFKNQVLEKLATSYRTHHQFTVAYPPLVNGTV